MTPFETFRANRLIFLVVLLALLACQPITAHATALPEGRKTITLVAADGTRLSIGTVVFAPAGDGATVSLTLDAPEFGDEFLSMRPFRCLPDAKEMWCHLPYPYATRGKITADDLVDLEYALLFLFKPPGAYGIDAWNGLYFKLMLDDAGLSGTLHEADFNVLAVPPADSDLRPIPHSALKPAAESRRFARMEIR